MIKWFKVISQLNKWVEFSPLICASSYDSCSNCGGQCTSNCLFNSCKERNAGGYTECGTYGCYAGGCYLTCNAVSSCAGNCESSCTGACKRNSNTHPSCTRICSNSSDSMYTTCAGLATTIIFYIAFNTIMIS